MRRKDGVRKIDRDLSLVSVNSSQEGLSWAGDFLPRLAGEKRDNILFLSGGNTPEPLYERLSEEKGLEIAQCLVVDERYGREYHKNSNELMIAQTGLENKNFHPVLENGVGLGETARKYDRYFSDLVGRKKEFGEWIAIMGVGADGHTASLAAGSQASTLQIPNYVMAIDNFPGKFKKRITLTFRALSRMDLLLVLVFGPAKQNVLRLMFEEGPLKEIPARFYLRPEIAKNTILITDRKI